MSEAKSFIIPKTLVMEAYKLVKANAGAAGVDKQTLEDFDKDLKNNLYKIWNRMSSGSYLPPPVKAVPIPKKTGGERILGVPTIGDRIAQTIVKLVFEPQVEPQFHQDSYGYRPNKSALDAMEITRKRCWKYNWVLEFDIKGLFDNIEHDLLMKAVKKHTDNQWVILYIERWLKAPMQLKDGTIVKRNKGTPQGGVISPVLANLFLHYVFDAWMKGNYPDMPWCRYADDGLVHCKTEQEALHILEVLKKRFEQCKLALHSDKTKIVYCKDWGRQGNYKEVKFDFLGYTFRPRTVKIKNSNILRTSFTPAVSSKALKAMRETTRKWNIRNKTEIELKDIAKMYNPVIRGWLEYYGRYCPSALYPFCRHFNKTLIAWVMHKYKKFRGHKTRASNYVQKIAQKNSQMFAHWKRGMIGGFV
jgi:RNA-directed DNA polymerase